MATVVTKEITTGCPLISLRTGVLKPLGQWEMAVVTESQESVVLFGYTQRGSGPPPLIC